MRTLRLRTLRLVSPEMRGVDIQQFQKVLNERLTHYHSRVRIRENGIYDRETAHAVAQVAHALGLAHYDGVPYVTNKIEHPLTRTPIEVHRAEERMKVAAKAHEARKSANKHGLAAIVLHAEHYLGVHETPPGSNWGIPYPAKWEEHFGFGSGVSWCFGAETLISTPDGLRRIDEIERGDFVYSGRGIARRVVKTHRQRRLTVCVRAHGLDGSIASTVHPYLTRRRTPTQRGSRQVQEAEWAHASTLRRGDFIAVPSHVERRMDGDAAVAYLIGRYLADGWHSDQARGVGNYYICGAHGEVNELVAAFRRAGFEERPYFRHTDVTLRLPSTMHQWLKDCGKDALAKRVPGVVFDWSAEIRKEFLKGYLDGDGHDTGSKTMAGTASRELAHGIIQVARSLGYVATLRHEDRSMTTVIEGRTVNQYPHRYMVELRGLNPDPHHRQVFNDDEFLWVPVRDVAERSEQEVFDLTLDSEHTYVADGVVVHNCGCFAGSMVIAAGGHVDQRVAFCPYIEADARSRTHGFDLWKPSWSRSGIEPGWLVLYNWVGGSEPEHVGIVKEIRGSHLVAVEGNTSGSNPSDGGEVAIMQRPYSFVVGYARPRL